MRTTVTLDPDVELILRERMETRGVSFKQALNDVSREGGFPPVDYAFSTPTFDLGVRVDLTKANRIVGELVDAEAVATMRVGR